MCTRILPSTGRMRRCGVLPSNNDTHFYKSLAESLSSQTLASAFQLLAPQ